MHLVADAADVEDDKILAIAVDQAFELADHDCEPAVPELPSPLRGRDERSSLLGVGVGGGGPHGQSDSGPPPPPPPPPPGGGGKIVAAGPPPPTPSRPRARPGG